MQAVQEMKTISKPRADQLIQEHEQLLSGRRNFESRWQILHDYFYIEGDDVNKTYSPGNELDASYLWDATTLETADVLASGFMNYLTPPSSKWFKLKHKNPRLSQNKAIGDFFEDVTDELHFALNRSNFYDQIYPSYKSSGVYGTSLIFEEEDIQDDIRFSNIPLKQVVFREDAKGRAVAYFIEFEYTALQAASRWGIEALSSEMQQEIKQGLQTPKHKFLLYIAQRHVREVEKTDKKNLPIEACWIDIKGRMIVEESGYNEWPAFVDRFDKRPGIQWGFSPAMKALPFVRLLNAVAKTNLRTMMKHTDPPIALPDNAFIAPFNMNPRAINYYRKDSMDNKSIMPFGNYGDPGLGLQSVDYYSQKVKSLMFYDTFLAFNQITKDMNNPEIMERINEKMMLLGSAVGRRIAEVNHPIIQRTLGILARRGKLPEPPPELMEDPNFEIDAISVLAQAQRRSELNTLTTGITMVGQVAQFAPEVLDKINPDRIVDEVWSITGAPVQVLRDDAEIEKIREGRAQQQMQMAEMQAAQVGAGAAKDAGAAAAGFAKAKEQKK